MSDPYVREHLGLEINNGILVSKVKVSEVIKGLLKSCYRHSESGIQSF